MSPDPSQIMAATSVAIGDRALLITGASGIGKSSLALALIDRGAKLISDDQTMLSVNSPDDRVFASPAPNIAGQIEVRNVGICTIDYCANPIAASLIIVLDETAPRIPQSVHTKPLLGLPIPQITLYPQQSILPIRAEYALQKHGLAW